MLMNKSNNKTRRGQRGLIKARKQTKIYCTLIGFFVMIICVCVGMKAKGLKETSEDLEEQQAILDEKIASEEAKSEELVEKEEYMKTKKFVEDMGREKWGLVYPDEIDIRKED